MFLKCSSRHKDGTEHRSWSIVESQRLCDRRRVHRHVFYLGEINDSQRAAWQKSIEVFEEDGKGPVQMSIFPEARYGKAERTWLMDRGIPTEDVLQEMRACDPPVRYLVGTPKGRLSRLEAALAEAPWQKAREGVEVKLLKIGAAKGEAGRAAGLVEIALPKPPQAKSKRQEPVTFSFSLNKEALRQARRREGRYLLRSNMAHGDPAALWQQYMVLTQVEEAFKNLKGDLALRPVFHQKDRRIEAHIFIAFLSYCLHVTLRRRLHAQAPGLTPRAVLEKFATMQMIDVHLPTTDNRNLILCRHTEPDTDCRLLLEKLNLSLPAQAPPKITSKGELAR